jgi:adenine-specific DNA glycosylase
MSAETMVRITADAIAICRGHLPTCRGCPLMTACHAPAHPLTWESLNRHTTAVNDAAAAFDRRVGRE